MNVRPFIVRSLAVLGLLVCAACSRSEPATAAPTGDTPADALARQRLSGRRVFDRVCATCHQANGQGVPGVFPPLAGSQLLLEPDPGRVIRIVLHGLQGPIEVKGQTYNAVMPPQGQALSDSEIADALTYARNAWGHTAPAVSAEAVQVVRVAVKRTTFWTWEELRTR